MSRTGSSCRTTRCSWTRSSTSWVSTTTRRSGPWCCGSTSKPRSRRWTGPSRCCRCCPACDGRRTHDYYRHGITSLFAAFNIADGTVISQLHRRHRATEFKKFLIAIDKAVTAELEVHLVADNYGTHKTPEIQAWLTRHPRFHVHFTPTGSSWINQVERWFGLLTDKLIRRGVHTSVQALEKDIQDWIRTWNANPRPFTWVKTADDILNSLADYLAKIKPRQDQATNTSQPITNVLR